MGWDIYLEGENGIVTVDLHEEGSTYALGGTDRAELSVTYNYGELLDFGFLHGQKAKDTLSTLRESVERLGIRTWPDYWAPTPGNVGYACSILLKWAEQHPEAVWRVSK